MSMRRRIKNLLQKRVLILDGATGTELQKRGMPAGVCPEVWAIQNPEALEEVHAAYGAAGSDIVYTCTFGANKVKLAEYGYRNVRAINRELSLLARRAVGKKVLVAGDIGPTGRFVEPFGDLPFEEAVSVFKEQVRGLLDGGVDLFVIETMIDIQEARAALIAVKELTDFFTIVTLTYEQDGKTLNGTDSVTALITLQSLGADAVGCNCSSGPEAMVHLITAMKPYATVPLVAKPNAGMPRLVGNKTVFDMNEEDFGRISRNLVKAGANMVGGCCGTTPAHLRSLKEHVSREHVVHPLRASLSAVSSARGFKVFKRNDPLVIVGEKINPSGKKALQDDLRAGKTSIIRHLAKEQENHGAELLDVNVSVHGVYEVETMTKVINLLSTVTPLPLVIDSADPEVVERALRIYPGRALVNSVSGEKEKVRKLLPIIAKYGSMFILLPIMDGEIPESFTRRQAIIQKVLSEAKKKGFSRDDIIVDGLVMTVASKPEAVREALRTIRWCTDRLRCLTILGLSNVSFGMPERRWMNAAFLSMAQAHGLTMAIANPAESELMNVKYASDVLMQKDRNASLYIQRFSGKGVAREGEATPLKVEISPEESIRTAILEGNRDDIISLVEAALASGTKPSKLVQEVMIPTIVHVGDLFEQRVFFLPQLIASAETMRAALGHLESYLTRGEVIREKKGRIILATVKGDIHDIGKNIVALILRNHGYEIIDLGRDVPADRIIRAIEEVHPLAVGLSALMTTTMENMREVIERSRSQGFECPFIVGGAAVTHSFAQSLGAAYAKDGVEAVRVIEGLSRQRRKGP